MDPFDHEWWIRATCRAKYLHLESSSPTDQTIWCTITIIVFTILLECFSRSEDCIASWRKCVARSSPEIMPNRTPTDPCLDNRNDAQSDSLQRMQSIETEEQTHIAKLRHYLFIPASTLLRLAIAILLLLPVLAAFCIRILDAITIPSLREECIPVIHPVSPNWIAIWLFNIFPVISACSAFVLIVYDAVLTWRAERLGYERQGKRYPWPPGWPFAAIMLAIMAWIGGLTSLAQYIRTVVLRWRER